MKVERPALGCAGVVIVGVPVGALFWVWVFFL